MSALPLALCHLHRSFSSQSSHTSLYCRFKTQRHFLTFTHTLYAEDTSVISVSDGATLAVSNRVDTPVAIAWTSSKIKVLRVFVGNGNLDEENWRSRIDAVERRLKSWHCRTLPYSGKATVINALALSQIWYVASLVFLPSWARAALNTLICVFFWSGKKDLVARKVLLHPMWGLLRGIDGFLSPISSCPVD